ncbi:MAG: diguanylate cyclase domain-containing protein [Microthrixaceae bacterium]
MAAAAGPAVVAAAVLGFTGLGGWPAAALVCVAAAFSFLSVTAAVVRPARAALTSARLDVNDARAELAAERADRDLRTRLDRALDGAAAEPAALRTGLRAVAEMVPHAEVCLLLSVPDEPRVGWSVALVDGALRPAVPLAGSPACRALATGSPAVTAGSHALDACAHLAGPDEVASTCLPLRLGDRLLGTVCVTSAPGEVPDPATLDTLAWIVERVGGRVHELRLRRGPSTAGPEDPVTGLPGEPALRLQLRDLVRMLTPFCATVVSLDGAEALRLASGGMAADDSLRLLADTICTTLRPDDLVCRLDGDRFAAVLTRCDAEQATAALERCREALVLATTEEEMEPVTFSAGIVESHRATSLEEIVRLADAACAAAHLQGGNRVLVSD